MGFFALSRISWEGYKNQLNLTRAFPDEFRLSPEFTENNICQSMIKHGNEHEQKALDIILNDLRELIPVNLSQKKKCIHSNLLRSIIYLWSVGKISIQGEAKKQLYLEIEKLNPKIDPRLSQSLFPFALAIYDLHNKRVFELQKWYDETKLKYPKENIWKPSKEQLTTITYNNALILANEKEIIPKAEFDKHLIEIQNTFKVWRGREIMRKKNKKRRTK
jgi:hypothetical protein